MKEIKVLGKLAIIGLAFMVYAPILMIPRHTITEVTQRKIEELINEMNQDIKGLAKQYEKPNE